jgi:hypothetical protein
LGLVGWILLRNCAIILLYNTELGRNQMYNVSDLSAMTTPALRGLLRTMAAMTGAYDPSVDIGTLSRDELIQDLTEAAQS